MSKKKVVIKGFGGQIWAVLGASVLAFVAILSLFDDIPDVKWQRNLIYLAIAVLSIAISAITNLGSILSQKRAQDDTKQSTQIFETVSGKLRPILIETLDNELRRYLSSAPDDIAKAGLNYYVFVFVEDYWRVLASSKDSSAVSRRIALTHDEGVIGVTAVRASPVFVEITKDGKGKVSSRQEQESGEQRVLTDDNRSKTDINLRWITATPIFVMSQGRPYDNRVIGVLSADSNSESDNSLMQSIEFQKWFDQLAMNVSSYIAVFDVMINTRLSES